jgi:large subunit ribosomal protein L32e
MAEGKSESPGAGRKQPLKSGGQTPTGKGPTKPAGGAAKGAGAPAPTKTKGGPKGAEEEVKIVEKATPKKHQAQAKPTVSPELKQRLVLRRAIASRRPKKFKRQQWYEYKRLEDSGWRKPTGVDSAMRRHFGYEQPVVRVGFRGPVESRGLHPTGFQEVRVETVADLARIDPKTQAARVSGKLGRRSLKLVYAEADKRGVRVLNRRKLE